MKEIYKIYFSSSNYFFFFFASSSFTLYLTISFTSFTGMGLP